MVKNKKQNIGILVGTIALFFILVGSCVSAFAVSSLYHKDYPLEISPGETKDIHFTLQNMAGDGDIKVRAKVVSGSEIMKFTGASDIFTVLAGTKVGVGARVSMPNSAQIGDSYPLEVEFVIVTEDSSGTFGFGSSVGRRFNAVVVPQVKLPEEKPAISSTTILIIAIIIIVIIIAIILSRKRKKK